MYLNQKKYFNNYYQTCGKVDYSKYYPLWKELVRKLEGFELDTVLEVGCGTGELGKMIEGMEYIGIDISSEAIKLSWKKKLHTFVWDAMELSFLLEHVFYDKKIEAFIFSEVLEHLVYDKEVLKQIPKKRGLFITVPDFKHKAHVRRFKTQEDVEKRYSEFFSGYSIKKIGKRYLMWGRT